MLIMDLDSKRIVIKRILEATLFCFSLNYLYTRHRMYLNNQTFLDPELAIVYFEDFIEIKTFYKLHLN